MPAPLTPQTILNFWFGSEADDAVLANSQARLWWSKNAELDAVIRTRFEALVAEAAAGQLESWRQTPQGELACIILLDQFPRNIYRNDPRCFAYDAQALAISLAGLKRRSDRSLRPVERLFFYLPLEHAENLACQERSIELFTRLVDEVPKEQRATFEGFLDYAHRHRDIIARFGRFPHRNAILGRASTPKELEFLRQPGSSF